MPKSLLCVDTATEICGVALVVDGSVIAEFILNLNVTHTQSVISTIEAVLTMGHKDISDIDAFAVTCGPGSFTGLRIGISTVKGLALATKKPVLGVSTLEVLAHQASCDVEFICPVIDARRNELYWALYRRKGSNIETVLGEQVGSIEMIVEKVRQPCCFIGNGVVRYREKLETLLDKPVQVQWANTESNGLRPAVMARFAWQRWLNRKMKNIQNVMPMYIRKSDAELARQP